MILIELPKYLSPFKHILSMTNPHTTRNS
ncbi:hypothetical protein MTR67_018134 [Solanum verrucosum]|uniref:Uncharacterized protein n=1 Tax=Solanum verrucosum TaxID=315347 RepID=A0AAF0QJ66_SOLVR|nr:hypothetical protein MTR67_018134 [Solanum verrucosum]